MTCCIMLTSPSCSTTGVTLSWMNAYTSSHCSGVVGSLVRGSSVGGGGLGTGGGLGSVDEASGGGGAGRFGGDVLYSAGRVTFLQEALFLRCASS